MGFGGDGFCCRVQAYPRLNHPLVRFEPFAVFFAEHPQRCSFLHAPHAGNAFARRVYEQVFGSPPLRLEALNGQSQIVIIPSDNAIVLGELGELVRLRQLAAEPYEPVGWTKCGACGFHDYCWPKAEAAKDVALVYDVDQGLSVQLHRQGVGNISELLDQLDAVSLSELKRPWGARMQKVGKKAGMILRRAEVMQSGRVTLLQPPAIPHSDHYVMFDLEGMPPQLDELDKIYLWGIAVSQVGRCSICPLASL